MEKEKSFAELLDEATITPRHYSPGEKIETTIVKITSEWIFLDLGAKSEGYLDKKEFLDEEGNLTVKEGDPITAYFLYSKHGEKLFTTKLLTRKSVDDYLFNAYQQQMPLEATVEKEIKGGFSVKISANAVGFCPYSQMDTKKIDDVAAYIGKKFNFIIIEYAENGRTIVLSRRPLLEKIEKDKRAALKDSLQKGMTIQGVVKAVRDFGAFVDIGGIQALLPVSEMAWGKVQDTKALYFPGDKIEAKIINLDWENDRVTLSIKDTLADPWNDVAGKYPEGSVHNGKVSRLTDFGAFITLEDGVDGLLHISKLAHGKKIKHSRDALSADTQGEVRVVKIALPNKRISLDLAGKKKETPAGEKEDLSGYMSKASENMGTLGDVLKKAGKKN